MTNSTTNASAILAPELVGPLLIQPLQTISVAAQVATVVNVHAHSFRVPVVAEDPSAAWVREGEEITPSDMTLTESVADLRKLAGLTVITNELRDDTNPAAAAVVGDGLARDISRKLDAAFFGELPAPAGLAALTGVTTIDAGGPPHGRGRADHVQPGCHARDDLGRSA